MSARRRLHPLAAAAALAAALAPAPAAANGRFPATVNTHTQPGEEDRILLPATFGLLLSSDGGASFQWVCEDAIGYGGTYDPDYAIAGSGDIYATTFEGLRVSRDGGCTWNTIGGEELAMAWVGEVEVGPDGKVWVATSSGGMPNDVYVSSDGGVSFVSSNLPHDTAWWKSLRVAPSDPDRIYVTGFLLGQDDGAGGTTPPQALLRRSTDGGASWDELPVTDFTFGTQPQLFIVGVSPTDPDVVFARTLGSVAAGAGDAIYRSEDAGASWTRVLELEDTIRAFAIRSDGATAIAGTVNAGVRISTDGGVTWQAPAQQPQMACLDERADGTLLACGANWDPDFFALGRSTDGMSWEKVLRFSEIAGPLSCPPGTIQYDTCASLIWPTIADQFGIGSADAGPTGDDGGTGADDDGGGGTCGGCNSAGGLALFGVVFAFPRRRRRS